ncbi:MAG: hypothetical protein JXB38_17605 [Anaerolineales bacterium]|nr:hypothetical protein [Anaerolineales bacterium]
MPREPLFTGLVVDEYDNAVEVAYVGEEPCYVVDDQGFRRHIPSEQVDRQVLQFMAEMVEGHEDLLSEQAAKMLGQEDIFSRAALENQFKNIEKQFEQVLETGIPEEGRAFMGMSGFKVRINLHGDVIEVAQPGAVDPDDE